MALTVKPLIKKSIEHIMKLYIIKEKLMIQYYVRLCG